MAQVVELPRERITQRNLKMLEIVLECGERHLRERLEAERQWLEKLRRGAVIEPGPLDLVECAEREVVRRLKVVRRESQPMLNSKRMAHMAKTPTLEPMPELPSGYDPARAEHIRELWDTLHATQDPDKQRRIWAELGDYILEPSE
jgi:hypothetical protein